MGPGTVASLFGRPWRDKHVKNEDREKREKNKVSKEFGIKFDNSEAAISSGVQTLNISTVVKPQIKSKPQNIFYM